ncbi:MAG: hypothetical protein HZB16_11205 [Armatimonadetes bacterium]|nr:hypothetical protein [Armatimonadota bacterium]
MRGLLVLLACACAVGVASPTCAKLPATVDEFKTRLETEGKEYKTAAHLWLEALYVYLNADETIKAKGREMVGLITSTDNADWEKEMLGRATLQKQPYLYQSYAKGAVPDNDYKMDPDKFELEFTTDKLQQEGKVVYLMVKCGGADNPRPFRMKLTKSGIWKMLEWSSLQVGIKKPASEQE